MSQPVSHSVTPSVVQLPEVNDLVKVSLGGIDDPEASQLASRIPSRVEEHRRDAVAGGSPRLVVAAPQFEGDLEAPAAGAACSVQWTSPRGLWVLPVAFCGEERLHQVRVWELEATGPPRREERRKFVRVGWGVPIELELRPRGEHAREVRTILERVMGGDLPDDRLAVQGHTRNIGEGGLLCVLQEVQLPADCPVIVKMTPSGREFAIPSRICWALANGSDRHLFETALAFNDPAEHGDELRPLLFAEQLRQRRDGLA